MQPIPVIPRANGSVHISPGSFLPRQDTPVDAASGTFPHAVKELEDFLSGCGAATAFSDSHQKATFIFTENPSVSHAEGYSLVISPDCCRISASSNGGAFYAVQTFKQLVDPRTRAARCCEISDFPAFSWRGFMLDSARTFCPVDEILRILDLMAAMKLNVFHWHLTDDQGWRIPIEGFPLLTAGSQFYSIREISAVVSYAAEKNILVVPEIDMPGHMSAALAAYPSLGCRDEQITAPRTSGIFPHILCAGKKTAVDFASHVITQLSDIFPSPFLHLGGDEIPLVHWRTCPDCQRRMNDLGLAGEKDVLRWFLNMMAEVAADRGRRIIIWNDSIDQSYKEDIVCQFWNPLHGGEKKLAAELEQGRMVILSRYFTSYLDMPYAIIPTSATYGSMKQEARTDEDMGKVSGGEFLLWTEHIGTRRQRDRHMFPRLLAGAENLWTDQSLLDWKSFLGRCSSPSLRFSPHTIAMKGKFWWNSLPLYRSIRKRLKEKRIEMNSRKSGI